jgi:tetratricopeptide (TPR) repeat protein
LVFCSIVAAAIQAVLALLEAPTGVRVGGAVVVAMLALALELDKLSTRRREHREVEQQAEQSREAARAEWLRKVRSWFRVWPPPRMDEVDLHDLGVARSALADRYAQPGDALPPYIVRDVDATARERLRAQGLLLIVGAPASGSTRTAYEAARADPSARVVVAPQAPNGLRSALDDPDVRPELEAQRRILLWLDRVDTFAGGGLTAAMLRDFRERSPGLRVVATIPMKEYRSWATEESDVADGFGDPLILEREPSEKELGRADAAYPGVDFRQGIAAAFTAVGALLVRLRGGDPDCPFDPEGADCSIARAVVAVAIDWAGTGSLRPLTIANLLNLAQQRRGLSEPSDPQHLASAVNWAARPVVQGAALLRRDVRDPRSEAVEAHAGVAEICNAEERPPETIWQAAIEDAATASDIDNVGRIGYQAHVEGETDIAVSAWKWITTLDEPAADWLKRAATFSDKRREARAEIPPRQQLLQLTEAAFGPDHPEVAAALNDLGIAWSGAGQPAKARELFERALVIEEREYGPDHPEVAITLNNLGSAWRELGQPAKARELFERALVIREREYGPDHPKVAATLTNFGSVWQNLGQPAKARELFERALVIQEREYGPDHPDVAATLNNLGNVWRDLGQPAKARELFERALVIHEREYGPDHPDTAATLTNLGSAWQNLEQPAKARELYERALVILHAHFPTGHPTTDVVARNLRTVAPDLIVLRNGLVVRRTEPPEGSTQP